MKRLWRSALALLLTAATVSCASKHDALADRIYGVPLGAFALAADDGNDLFVLVKSKGARAVYHISTADGALDKGFGVNKDAVTIAYHHATDRIFVGIGNSTTHVGAIEVRAPSGKLSRTIPVPGPVVAASHLEGDTFSILIDNAKGREALGFDAAQQRVTSSVPFPRSANSFDICEIGHTTYAIVSEAPDAQLHRLELSAHPKSTNLNGIGTSPLCDPTGDASYALQQVIDTKVLDRLALPSFVQQSVLPAPADAVALERVAGGRLAVLECSAGSANVRIVDPKKLEDVAANDSSS